MRIYKCDRCLRKEALTMSYPIKVADLDLSFFLGDPAGLILTAEEAEHGYDYTLTYYHDDDDSKPLGCSEHWTFYDQPSADAAADFMAAKIKEFLS